MRTLGTEASADSIADSPIRAEPDGTVIRVGDVAQVTESVPDTGRSIYFQGEPAISLQIRRGPEGDAIRQQAVIREYLEEIRPTLPANITIENYDVRADLILGRVLLLRDNAFYGVLIVLASCSCSSTCARRSGSPWGFRCRSPRRRGSCGRWACRSTCSRCSR